jgi:integrase
MTRGSIQLRHRKACGATGKDARACRCTPTTYAVWGGMWSKLGYLERGWRKADLEPFETRLGEMRRKLAAGEPWQPQKVMRLAEWAEQWLDHLKAAVLAGRVSKLTYNCYVGIWERHLAPAFGALPLAAIDAAAIRRYADSKLADWFASTSINGQLTPLSAMLSDAVADGLIVANPCRQPRRGRHGATRRTALFADQRTAPKFLELYEARALLAATPDAYRAMVLAALTTGARRCELLALRWENVDFARNRIAIVDQLQAGELVPCKYDSAGEVVLYSGLAAILGPRRRAEGFVFLDPDGQPWTNAGPGRAFLTAAYDAAGLRRPGQQWHVLRHTYASALAAGGVRRDVVERLMRHTGKGVTSLYTHLFEDAFDGVEEALHAAFGAAAGVNETSTGSGVPQVLDGHCAGAPDVPVAL